MIRTSDGLLFLRQGRYAIILCVLCSIRSQHGEHPIPIISSSMIEPSEDLAHRTRSHITDHRRPVYRLCYCFRPGALDSHFGNFGRLRYSSTSPQPYTPGSLADVCGADQVGARTIESALRYRPYLRSIALLWQTSSARPAHCPAFLSARTVQMAQSHDMITSRSDDTSNGPCGTYATILVVPATEERKSMRCRTNSLHVA